MDLSIFLAQLFGLYFLIAGGIIMYRQKSFMPIIGEVLNSKPLIIVLGFGELVAGLAIVIAHPVWTFDWEGLLTFIGVMLVAESLFYLAVPFPKMHRIFRQFNTPTWYTSGGLLAIVLGAYLTGKGFGFW